MTGSSGPGLSWAAAQCCSKLGLTGRPWYAEEGWKKKKKKSWGGVGDEEAVIGGGDNQ